MVLFSATCSSRDKSQERGEQSKKRVSPPSGLVPSVLAWTSVQVGLSEFVCASLPDSRCCVEMGALSLPSFLPHAASLSSGAVLRLGGERGFQCLATVALLELMACWGICVKTRGDERVSVPEK